jgi:hypothetical protein
MVPNNYLADLLALQILNANLAHHINHIYSGLRIVLVNDHSARGSSAKADTLATPTIDR